MLEKFLSYINTQKLILPGERTVLAISGGIDSMVLLHLFRQAGLVFRIAHVNHNLRGEDSKKDAEFISGFCKKQHLEHDIHTISVDHFREGNMQSIARNIRYEFFETLRIKYDYNKVATAHHKDDNVETFLMHIIRGAGLKGLRGIQPNNKRIIRPLLFAEKSEISRYAKEHNIEYREDYSNETDKYLRNKIRHHVIPALKSIDQNINQKIANTISHVSDSFDLLESMIQMLEAQLILRTPDELTINLKELKEIKGHKTLLHYFISPFGFNESMVENILKSSQSGAGFPTSTHFAIINRDDLIVRRLQTTEHKLTESVSLNILAELRFNKQHFTFQIIENKVENFTSGFQYLDFDKIPGDIKVRKWKAGDRITPLGMQGKSQKVSDILTNKKIPAHEKPHVMILVSSEEIITIPGLVISEKFKISSDTKRVLLIQKIPSNL
ncbi:MAG: tRNA lysidine(34) synthetase TilS [Saprospiraceae bacterium]|nr:tRNA lysidine(34) synthetase TilS [Saprospiraceae bacterium]